MAQNQLATSQSQSRTSQSQPNMAQNQPHENGLLRKGDVRLRACELSDLNLMYALENDSTVWPATASSQPVSAKALRDFLSRSQSNIYHDLQLRLTIDYRNQGSWTAAGFVDLFDFNARHLRAEVGIGLKSAFRHRGIGHQALSLLEQYARDTLLIHQLYAYVLEGNLASARLFQSCHFLCSATLHDWVKTPNSYCAALFFQKIL